MRTVGLLVEGQIDVELLKPLFLSVFEDILGWRRPRPVVFPYPPNGYGAIPKNLRHLVRLHQNSASEWRRLGCDAFLVIHDSRKTETIQSEIKDILRENPSFPAVYGLAIQETEAWVLGDAEHLNSSVFHIEPLPTLPCKPERDPDPKMTLTKLFIARSRDIDSDRWNQECARKVAPHLRWRQIRTQCPQGFGKLVRGIKNRKSALG